MPKIINLSAIHTLQPIHHGVSAFARLCDKYSKSIFSCCPSFFNHSTNYAWVMYQYYQSLNTLINPYKLGRLTTKDFFTGLLKMFPFMENSNLGICEEDIQRLNSNKASLYSLRNTVNPSMLDYAKALLEEAWNSIITFTDEDVAKVQKLFEEGNDIYLMSNTNELNVFKILQWLQTNFPNEVDLNLNFPNITQQEELLVLQIGSGKNLVVSYLYHTCKTAEDNSRARVPNTTPTLLQAIVSYVFKGSLDDLTVISQYPKDLEAAAKLNIPKIYLAGEYFQLKSQTAVSLLN